MLWKGIGFAALICYVTAGFTGCASQADFLNMKNRADTAEKINTDIRRKTDKLEADYEKLRAKIRSIADLEARNAALREEVATLKAKVIELAQFGKGMILPFPTTAGFKVNPATGGLILPGDLLFALGSWTIKEAYKPTIKTVADLIKKEHADKMVYVDGYTDRVPISKSIKYNPDNWFLGCRRAHAVMEELRKNGISQKQLVISSFGWLQEIDPNKKQSQKNRRVEIRLLNKIPVPEKYAGGLEK